MGSLGTAPGLFFCTGVPRLNLMLIFLEKSC
nr:MAG TPA: hypothetical protein [Caudoviricetes sp.]